MTERERLIQLLQSSHCVELWNHNTDDFIEPNPIEKLADYLLENGVIVPPCKVGDAVYFITGIRTIIKPAKVTEVIIGEGVISLCVLTDWTTFKGSLDTFYMTREEAEKALAERSRG